MSKNIQQHIDFSISTYCQAKCRSCQRTNQDTSEKSATAAPKLIAVQRANFQTRAAIPIKARHAPRPSSAIQIAAVGKPA